MTTLMEMLQSKAERLANFMQQHADPALDGSSSDIPSSGASSPFDTQVQSFRDRVDTLKVETTENTEKSETSECAVKSEQTESSENTVKAEFTEKADEAVILKIENYDLDEPLYVSDPEKYAAVETAIREVLEEMGALSDKLDATLDEQKQTEKFHDSVREELGTISKDMTAITEGQDKILLSEAENRAASREMISVMEEVRDGQKNIVSDLEEKIHTENVRSYRNLQGLLKESDQKTEALGSRLLNLEGQGKLLKAAIMLGVLNLAGVTAVILLYLGII